MQGIAGPPESTLHPNHDSCSAHVFSVKIPSSLRSVLHCRYPETTLNPHSTSMGVHYKVAFKTACLGSVHFVLVGHPTLSEQLAHSAVDLHLKEISEFLHGSEMNAVQQLHLSQPPNQHGTI